MFCPHNHHHQQQQQVSQLLHYNNMTGIAGDDGNPTPDDNVTTGNCTCVLHVFTCVY